MSIVHIRRAELAALRAQEPVAWLYRSITGLQRLHTEQGPMLKADMDAARDFPHAHSCIPLYAATHCTTPKVNSDERSEAKQSDSTAELGPERLTDADLCALEYAVKTLRAIAERQEQVGDVLEPVNDIRAAAARAKTALRRLEPVVRKLDGLRRPHAGSRSG